ncbi:MAG: DUF2442 domain-containing protein [Proteobacteria bacterium]|jgi:hypothetical protein|nr:DUF2442 domain-containing protein [Pseudomonadota bacterium]
MIPRIVEAEHRTGHKVYIRFAHGPAGVIDLADELDGPVFAPLADPKVFATLALSPDTRTVVWPNGADFAPEFLLDRLEATDKAPMKRGATAKKRARSGADVRR